MATLCLYFCVFLFISRPCQSARLTVRYGRIEELENKIGAGLIEEVIQVAEGELKLVDTMVQSKA